MCMAWHPTCSVSSISTPYALIHGPTMVSRGNCRVFFLVFLKDGTSYEQIARRRDWKEDEKGVFLFFSFFKERREGRWTHKTIWQGSPLPAIRPARFAPIRPTQAHTNSPIIQRPLKPKLRCAAIKSHGIAPKKTNHTEFIDATLDAPPASGTW